MHKNVAITDDAGYAADPSAMLDVKATDKGMLVPRVTNNQRTSIANPAQGLLVFDTDEGSFYFYDSSSWVNLSHGNPSGLFGQSGNYIFLNDTSLHFGVGTHTPEGKFEVKADAGITPTDPIFGVVNYNGDTVFAVYPEGVRINVADDATKAASSKSGFAVGGFSLTKGATAEYLRVTPDSVRIYIEDTIGGAKATASKGGFAIGGFSLTKGLTSNYLTVSDATTQVYVTDSMAGFGVTNIESGNSQGFLDMNTQNYFIGHQSGQFTTPGSALPEDGIYNSFFGYQSGFSNVEGHENVFIGYKSGYSNNDGYENVFIGSESGYYNSDGRINTFVGSESGHDNTTGDFNAFFGNKSGWKNNTGDYNTFLGCSAGLLAENGYYNSYIGYAAGSKNTTGDFNIFLGPLTGFWNTAGNDNVFIGFRAGYYNNGSENVFIGDSAGYNEAGSNKLYIDNTDNTSTSALVYGEFDNDILTFNANVGIYTTAPEGQLHIESAGDALAILEADNNNSGENDNPRFELRQDGAAVIGGLGYVGNSGTIFTNSIGNSLYLVSDYAGSLQFGTNNTAHMTISSAGNVGVGTSSPSASFKLDVAGNINLNKGISSGGALYVNSAEALWYNGTYFSWGYGGSVNYFADKVGIGITTPSYKLELPNNSTYYYGSARAYSWATYSDSRVKKNQEELDYGIEELMKLVPKKYDHHTSEFKNEKLKLNKDYVTTIGLIAQEVYEIIPEAAEKPVDEATDLWSLDYEKLIPVMINSIKELNRDLIIQTKENETLKAEIETIKSIISASTKK